MSNSLIYNDILNYTTGLNEYLYKSGIKDIFRITTFNGAGIIEHNNTRCFYLAKNNNKSDEEIKKNIRAKYTVATELLFAANEPNFNAGEKFHTFWHERVRAIEPKFYIKTNFKVIVLTSDFNHIDFDDSMQKYDYAFPVYFFFQGYLAYQWYRQYKMYDPIKSFSYKYNSMSRLISGMRSYRLYLTSKLAEYDILKYGQASCSNKCPYSGKSVTDILDDRYCCLNTEQVLHVKKHLKNLPLRFDKPEHKNIPNTSYEIDWFEMSKSFLHVVNETVFFETFNHLTEKTFKPIVCMRPFIIVSTPGSLAYLKRYGFRTFEKWIDESYDSEPDGHKRLDMIAKEINKIASMSISQLQDMYKEMLPILEHNHSLFFGSFEQDILDELIDNCRHTDY